MEWNRKNLARHIALRLTQEMPQLKAQYAASAPQIGYFFIDDVLPEAVARDIFAAFPDPAHMTLKNTLRERKYIAVQMDRYQPLLEEAIYAFQEPEIVSLVSQITGIQGLMPDANLYAGGLSMMGEGHYLNPHLDNSHDKDRQNWRVLNLLYYVTPDWKLEYGGNLELWPNGLEQKQTTIESKCNRLAVMATHNASLHSVSPVVFAGNRCCVSNYYFSAQPLRASDSFHVTSFRGRPGQWLNDWILRADVWLRMGIRKVFSKGVKENPHVYKKK